MKILLSKLSFTCHDSVYAYIHVCMYILCMFASLLTYVDMYLYMYVLGKHVCLLTYVRMYVCIYVYACLYAYVHPYVCIYACMSVSMMNFVPTCLHTYTLYARMHVCICNVSLALYMYV